MLGELKPGTLADSVLLLAPLLKPDWNAAWEPAVICCPLAAEPGWRLKGAAPPKSGPNIVKPTFDGALFRKVSAIVPGNTSENNPNPPRTTVPASVPLGENEKPIRGLTEMA